MFHPRKPSAALVVSGLALVMASTGGAYAATKPLSKAAARPAVANPAPTAQSSRFCTPTLCIDADPASGGSGGFGFNNTLNKPISVLRVGNTYPFTVTVVQDGNENADGSITLTWNPADFTGPVTGGDSGAQCTTASTGNAMSCTYTDLSHQFKSDSFNFTALRADAFAHVDATVEVNGEEASAEFPVMIKKAVG
jgi:hypothetical protein